MNIAVVGSWHNAFVTAACLAHVGHEVTLVNERAAPWLKRPILPLDEPGLPELMAAVRWANLGDALDADVTWIACDTPLHADGSPDVAYVFDVAKKVALPRKIVVSSQMPLGSCRALESVLGVPVVYVPENMRVGNAIEGFLRPDRLVIGATLHEPRMYVLRLLYPIVASLAKKPSWNEPFLCSLETAEMVKHATNAFLATSISFANEIARIGSVHGVDSDVVAQALRADSRIGQKAYVRAGAGFGNGTLERDLIALQKIAPSCSPLIDAVLAVNERTTKPEPTPHELHLKGKK